MTAPNILPPSPEPTRAAIGGPRVGAAPPLTPEKIAAYRALVPSASEIVADALLRLCGLAEHFQKTPASSLPGSGKSVGLIVPLTETERRRIWDKVPWQNDAERLKYGKIGDDSIDDYRKVFRALDAGTLLSNAAWHLLWYALELALDREPITTDRL